MRLLMALWAPILVLLSACASHPLVEDFSRKTTYQIVERIRCEAALGLKTYKDKYPNGAVPASALGFDFTFTITENDKAAAGKLDFINPYVGGKFSLTLKGSADKKRQSERAFRVLLTFADLQDDVEKARCSEKSKDPNLVYPITGSIGLDEVIETYLKLNTKLTTEAADIKKPVKVFSDTLTFTTILNAGITPNLEIGAGSGNFKLRNASIDASVERSDIHKVVIAVSTCKSPDCRIAPALRAARSVGTAGYTSAPASGEDVGTNNVIDELDRLRNREDGRRVLDDFLLSQ